MKLEIEEKRDKHDVWGCYVCLFLPDNTDYVKAYKDIMKVVKKYMKKSAKVKKDGVEVAEE